MDALLEAAPLVLTVAAACIFAWRRNLMTLNASIAAFAMALTIGFSVDVWHSIAFLVFPAIGFAATKFDFSKKAEEGLQEGREGERHLLNILGTGIVPTAIALVHLSTGSCGFELTMAFISALAVSTSDTVASEIGVRDERAYTITTMKPCKVGTNGGVSRYGMFVSTIWSLIFSLAAYVIIFHDLSFWFLVPALAGVLGNIMDSVFGAVFENEGKMSKYTVNGSTALMGAVAGFLIASVS